MLKMQLWGGGMYARLRLELLLNYLGFQSFDYEHTWWIELDVSDFITITSSTPLLVD
jgi:hypothetical protein